jgi:hypothetical protein
MVSADVRVITEIAAVTKNSSGSYDRSHRRSSRGSGGASNVISANRTHSSISDSGVNVTTVIP